MTASNRAMVMLNGHAAGTGASFRRMLRKADQWVIPASTVATTPSTTSDTPKAIAP